MKTFKKLFVFLLAIKLLLGLIAGGSLLSWAVGVDITDDIIDQNFRSAVYRIIPKETGERIWDTDVEKIEVLGVQECNIQSLAGLQYFTGLEYLDCSNNKLTALPALPPGLTELDCHNNQLAMLPELPPGLTRLLCSLNQLTILPKLPPVITELICYENQLTTLPELPYGLEELNCISNRLTALPELPSGLTKLWCAFNQLVMLPELPSALTQLGCYENQLTTLPGLPSNLEEFDCAANQFTILPELPEGLIKLDCYNNKLATLPELPSGLTELVCHLNQLTILPELPPGLRVLICQTNILTSLPELPEGLTELCCSYNRLTSLPELPSGLLWLDCGGNQFTSLPSLPSGLTTLYCNTNRLTELDVTGLSALNFIDCSKNDMAEPVAVKGFPNIWGGTRFKFYPQNDKQLPPPLTGISSWSVDEVNELDTRSVIPLSLRNDFQQPIRRDEFTALLVNIEDYATQGFWSPNDSPFTDISDSLYKALIYYAYASGLVDGTSTSTFSPSALLTREQTAKFLYKIVSIIDDATLGDDTPGFIDNTRISNWAKPYVAWCQKNNIMHGRDDNTFDPQGYLTREETMVVAERLIVRFKWPASYTHER